MERTVFLSKKEEGQPYMGPKSCTICLEPAIGDEACSLSCGCKAIYCQTCLLRWLQDLGNRSCPTCRAVKVSVIDVRGGGECLFCTRKPMRNARGKCGRGGD